MNLEDYAKLIEGKTCRWHKNPVALPRKVEMYPHANGWEVDGYDEKQWLYVTCDDCDYQWSLWKLGVDRP